MGFTQAQRLTLGSTFGEWYLYWEDGHTPYNITMISYELA